MSKSDSRKVYGWFDELPNLFKDEPEKNIPKPHANFRRPRGPSALEQAYITIHTQAADLLGRKVQDIREEDAELETLAKIGEKEFWDCRQRMSMEDAAARAYWEMEKRVRIGNEMVRGRVTMDHTLATVRNRGGRRKARHIS